jgi:hypothetical protein
MRLLIPAIIVGFAALSFLHAWAFTHYRPAHLHTTPLNQLSTLGKIRTLLTGARVRRPTIMHTPAEFAWPFETLHFAGSHSLQLEAWRIGASENAPIVILFPAYAAGKDSLFAAAEEFRALGCECWMVDPHGAGASEGATNSVGYYEAEDVAAAFREAARLAPGRKVFLYGNSMGAVAVLRAVADGLAKPDGLIAECPFSHLREVIGNNFSLVHLPSFPLAQGMTFWVGVQQGFDGFRHNPSDYARRIESPTLIIQGEWDDVVGRSHVREVAEALGTHGQLALVPQGGHEFLVLNAPEAWRGTVRKFLAAHVPLSPRPTALPLASNPAR